MIELNKYSVFFDKSSPYWTDGNGNAVFVRHIENRCNVLLKRQGYLFLNEVLMELGLHPIKTFEKAGWIFDDDAVVTFELSPLLRMNDDQPHDIIAIKIDFNCDDDIFRKQIEGMRRSHDQIRSLLQFFERKE